MGEKGMEKEIPLEAMVRLFAEQGAAYVENGQIPADLKVLGWRSETSFEKANGGYEVTHFIFAPGEGEAGEAPRCIFKQKMRVGASSGTNEEGNSIHAIEFCPEEKSPLLKELLRRIEVAQKTLEFEVRF